MSSELLKILPLAGVEITKQAKGSIGEFKICNPTDLYIDDSYQRSILSGGAKRLKAIAEEFDFKKISPVIGAWVGDKIAIIDGQHRATAAATCGIKEIPCYILTCTKEEAAASFASINGNVTAVNLWDIWFAEIVAGDENALAIKECLDAANVQIVRRSREYRVGETRAVSVMRRAHKVYGKSLFITVLQCITETGDGNPGLLVGAVINGIALAIRNRTDLLDNPEKLFDFFDKMPLQKILDDCKVEYATTGNPVQGIFTRKINEQMGIYNV